MKEVSRGALNQEYSNGLVNPMIQPGSGSMDLQLQLQYAFRYEHWGLITTVQGKYDGKDASGYRIPHQMSVSAESFHQWGSDSTLHVLAKAGFLMDHSCAGSYIGPSEFSDMASQRQVLWTAGGEVYFRHLFVGLQAGFGRSSHQTEILQSGSSRMSLSAGFTF